MYMNSLPINHGSGRYITAVNGPRSIRLANRDWPIGRRWLIDVIINTVNHGVGRITKPLGTFCNSIEYGLEIGRRAGNHAQNLTRCRLLFQSLGEISVAGLQLIE